MYLKYIFLFVFSFCKLSFSQQPITNISSPAKDFYPSNSPTPIINNTSAACLDTSSKIIFETQNRDDVYSCSVKTADGGMLIGGSGSDRNSGGSNGIHYALLTKFDNRGNRMWTKEIQNDVLSFSSISVIKELSDGSIVICGTEINKLNFNPPDNYRDFLIAKLTQTGDIIWFKTYQTLTPSNGCNNNNIFIGAIEEGANGDLLFTGTMWSCPLPKLLAVFKLNASGVIQWKYKFAPFYNNCYGAALFYEGNTITVVNQSFAYPSPDPYHVDFIKLDYATGSHISTIGWGVDKPYSDAQQYSFINENRAIKLNNGNYCVYGLTFGTYNFLPNTNVPHFAVLEFNSTYNFVNGYVIKTEVLGNANYQKIQVDKNKNTVYSVYKNLSYPDENVYVGSVKQGQVMKERKFEYRNMNVFNNNIELYEDGSYRFLNSVAPESQATFYLEYLFAHDTDTSSTCMGLDTAFSNIEQVNFLPVQVVWTTIDTVVFKETPHQYELSKPFDYSTGQPCVQVSECDTLKIHGQSVVCDYHQSLIFSVYKNPSCGSKVNWSLPSTIIQQIQILNDTTVQINLNQQWQGWLYASIITSCGLYTDSIFINAGNTPGAVNLGDDKLLCPGNTITINAGTGYASYLWNTGSSDSSITVNFPGIYYIDVADACGQFSTDTIIITASGPVPFDIGPDRIKCNNDTIHINATAGFTNYRWEPNYAINAINLQNVIVNPSVDTSYYVIAEKTPGCFAFDTVKVRVYHSPSIYLGKDTSLCSGQTLTLNAGAGFVNYLWNNGSSNNSITVNNTGSYFVRAANAQGCYSDDTLNILQVFPLPVVTLPKNNSLCIGETRTLDAGNFSTYLWYNGATSRTVSVQTKGIYYVDVTDIRGCKGSDTVIINTLLSPPRQFLPIDTTICYYSNAILKAQPTFADYKWNTGGNQPSITINTPGVYWLTVTDQLGCKGSDSIIVLGQQCLKGLYVPTAFTPNNDNTNDKLKAILAGDILSFEFEIYNRYGMLVFKTKNQTEGWDGKIRGVSQEKGGYVWVCKYQLLNEVSKIEKGSFILIR